MGLAGRATAAGTARYAARLAAGQSQTGHFRTCQGLTLSSIGAGTYLGELSDAIDKSYRIALAEAVRLGVNVIDTAVSYRAQRSEGAVGGALADLMAAGEASRDELLVASKAGFIAYRLARATDRVKFVYDNFLSTGVAQPEEIAGGIHCMAPDYLSQQISWSLRNTGLHTIDIYFLHDPDTQLAFVDRDTFRNRLRLAFARLEEEVTGGRIGCYGIASWNGLRRPPMAEDYLSIETLLQLAVEGAGPNHHFRALELPLNASMHEAAVLKNQRLGKTVTTCLGVARELGLLVLTSASMMQAQAFARMSVLREVFPELVSDAQRALQFARSLSGVTTVLAGMSRLEHVRENLALAALNPEADRAERILRSMR